MKALLPLLITSILGSLPLLAQETAPPSSRTVPPDINGFKTVIPAPAAVKPLKVAIYDGGGSSKAGVEKVSQAVTALPGSTVTLVTPAEMGTVDLKAFDAVVFCGGSASVQAKNIGETGLNNVREFVRGGGGYVGICAGAYLACTGFDWSLGILNARTVSSKWRRGTGYLDMEVVPAGKNPLGEVNGIFKVRYNNGPVIKPDSRPDIPAYTPLALFRTEVAENGSPAGVMVDSPAAASGSFGQGRVFISSPHPENTPGLEHLIPRAILWAAGQDQTPAPAKPSVVP
ncbi:BPL-N domain-containing protein [Prosthecobacter sp. SYSU 5D2]|uniref:BPL-N domain-containing protein n=1 Tax=Prosthecobacter sp. SYSU 5D2 TaxID=3134134 RepID=UPI0031FF1D85